MVAKSIRFCSTTKEEPSQMKKRFSVSFMLCGILAGGCGSHATPTSNSVSPPTSAIATTVSQHNMASWHVQVVPTPPLTITTIYFGAKAENPTLTVYAKTSARPQWRRVLSTRSKGPLIDREQAISVRWPSNAPQFFGNLKVEVSWSVGGHLYVGNVVVSVKPLKTGS